MENTNNLALMSNNQIIKTDALLNALHQVVSEGANNLEIMSNEIGEVALALSKAQASMEKLVKSTKGHDSYYAELAKCIEVSRQALSDNDLCVTQSFKPDAKYNLLLVTTIAHKSGQWFKSYFPIERVPSNRNNSLQQLGSGITYVRRYSYNASVGLAQEDDDGKSAVSNAPVEKSETVNWSQQLRSLCKEHDIIASQFANFHDIVSTDINSMKNGVTNFLTLKEEFEKAAKESLENAA